MLSPRNTTRRTPASGVGSAAPRSGKAREHKSRRESQGCGSSHGTPFDGEGTGTVDGPLALTVRRGAPGCKPARGDVGVNAGRRRTDPAPRPGQRPDTRAGIPPSLG